jgi:predicted nucleic-acid-binding Zn-ribbon protein
MKNGICPKCNEKHIHRIHRPETDSAISLGWSGTVFLDKYVCVNCGYIETYTEDTSQLKKIAEKYPKVN